MRYLELESVPMHTPPKPRGPSSFDAFLRIAQRGVPFTAVGGRAFMRVPAQSFGGYRTLSIRSRAFRQWFFDQSLSGYETIPTAHAFSAILHYLEAQAARDPNACNIRVPYRVDCRGISHTPEKILLDLANPAGEFVQITAESWRVGVPSGSGEGVPFETSPSTCSLPAPQPAGDPDPPTASPLDTLRSTLNPNPPNSHILRHNALRPGPCCGAAWQANATRFSTIGNAAEVVGQTPWSARDAFVPHLEQMGSAACRVRAGRRGRRPRSRGTAPRFMQAPSTGKTSGIGLASCARPGGYASLRAQLAGWKPAGPRGYPCQPAPHERNTSTQS